MKKFGLFLILAMMVGKAFCEAPNGWDTMYFNSGEKEYCSTELSGDLTAQLELYGNAIVVTYEAPAKIKGDISLYVNNSDAMDEMLYEGKQDQYNTVTLVLKGEDMEGFLTDIDNGSHPLILTLGNTQKKVKLNPQAAKNLNQACKWIKGLPNALKY